jgi:hypothetical protein
MCRNVCGFLVAVEGEYVVELKEDQSPPKGILIAENVKGPARSR